MLRGSASANADRNERRKRRTRSALLEAARELFREKGVDATTVSDIAARADVAYGTFYNHFKTLDDVVTAVAGASVEQILARVTAIMADVSDPDLLPCVGARVILRTFLQDPVVHWLLERPYLFVSKFQDKAGPFMRAVEGPGVANGRLRPAAGHEVWIRTLPWVLLSELNDTVAHGNALMHEDSFARICMRLMGIREDAVDGLLRLSMELVGPYDATGPVSGA